MPRHRWGARNPAWGECKWGRALLSRECTSAVRSAATLQVRRPSVPARGPLPAQPSRSRRDKREDTVLAPLVSAPRFSHVWRQCHSVSCSVSMQLCCHTRKMTPVSARIHCPLRPQLSGVPECPGAVGVRDQGLWLTMNHGEPELHFPPARTHASWSWPAAVPPGERLPSPPPSLPQSY